MRSSSLARGRGWAWAQRGEVIGLGLLGLAIWMGTWEAVVRSGIIDSRDVPPFSHVLSAFFDLLGSGAFWSAVGQTLEVAGIGLAIATAIAVPLGLVVGRSEIVRSGLRPTIEFLRPMPGVALIPMVVLLWGATATSDIFLVAFGCLWPMLMQCIYGVQSVDEVARRTARAYGIGTLGRIRWVEIPGAIPYLATGLRICTAVALIIAVSAELIIGTPGIGRLIRRAQDSLELDQLYALILASGVLGVAISLISEALEKRFLAWHPSQRKGVE